MVNVANVPPASKIHPYAMLLLTIENYKVCSGLQRRNIDTKFRKTLLNGPDFEMGTVQPRQH
jgi:hypothetical protein